MGEALGIPSEFKRYGMFTCAGMVGDVLCVKHAGVRRDDILVAFATCEIIRKIDHIGSADFQRRLEWRYHENARSAADPFAIEAVH